MRDVVAKVASATIRCPLHDREQILLVREVANDDTTVNAGCKGFRAYCAGDVPNSSGVSAEDGGGLAQGQDIFDTTTIIKRGSS